MNESDMKVKRIWHESVQKTETLGHGSTVPGWTISLHSVASSAFPWWPSWRQWWSLILHSLPSSRTATGVEREKNKNSWAPCLIFPFAVQMQLGFEELLKIAVFLAERKPSQLGDLAMVMRHASTLVTSDSTKEKFKLFNESTPQRSVMAKELTEGQFTWRLVKRSKINQPSVLQEFTDVRPHRMNVTKAWQHFWKSQGTTRRYSWMGTWCRHNLWSFGWMDAAPLDDWRPLQCSAPESDCCPNCLVKRNYLRRVFCCIRVVYFSSAYVLPMPLQCPPTPCSCVLICLCAPTLTT